MSLLHVQRSSSRHIRYLKHADCSKFYRTTLLFERHKFYFSEMPQFMKNLQTVTAGFFDWYIFSNSPDSELSMKLFGFHKLLTTSIRTSEHSNILVTDEKFSVRLPHEKSNRPSTYRVLVHPVFFFSGIFNS